MCQKQSWKKSKVKKELRNQIRNSFFISLGSVTIQLYMVVDFLTFNFGNDSTWHFFLCAYFTAWAEMILTKLLGRPARVRVFSAGVEVL